MIAGALVAFVIGSILLGTLLALRTARRPTCPRCYYPLHRCDCPASPGDAEGLDP